MFNPSHDPDRLIIKIPTAAGWICDWRHQPMFVIENDYSPGDLGQVCRHFNRVNGLCGGLEDLQRAHRVLLVIAVVLSFPAETELFILITFSLD
jgi:hypothetical protein